MWSLTKKLGTDYSAHMIMLWRMCVAILIPLILIWQRGQWHELTTRQPGRLLLRAALGSMSLFTAIWCIPRLPLATVSTLTQLGPVFIAIMGMFFLREKLSKNLALTLPLALVGALLASGSPEIGLSTAAGVMILSNLLFSASIITTRQLVQTHSSLTITFYASLFAILCSGIATFFEYKIPTLRDALLLSSLGLCAGIAQLCITEAHRHADASKLAPFAYSSVILSFLAGFVFWSEIPSTTELYGAALIIGSTFFLWYSNRKLSQ